MTSAEEKVNGPGIALMVIGVLSVVGNLLSFLVNMASAFATIMALLSGGSGGDWMAFVGSQGWSLAMNVIGFLVAFLVVFAGMKLRQLENSALVYAGAIAACLPCCGVGVPCCCFGLPVGIWVLVTMQDDEVKAAFDG